MNLKFGVLASALSLAFVISAVAADEPKKDAAPEPEYTLTGHVDLVSAYYLRGVTNTYGNARYTYGGLAPLGSRARADWNNANGDAPESDKPVLQWGADYVHSSGWFVGYWGSQINYSYKALGDSYDIYTGKKRNPLTNTFAVPFYAAGNDPNFAAPVGPVGFFQTNKSIENDIYGGYNGKFGDLGYTVGLTYYYYINGNHSDAPESKLALTYGDFALNAQTLLADTTWGNSGDTYWTLVWTKALPYDLSFTANLGYYTYTKEGKFLGTKDPNFGTALYAGTGVNNSCVEALGGIGAAPRGSTSASFFDNGCYWNQPGTNGPISGGFRHLILGVSQPIGSTGLTWNVQAIVSGVNRFNVQQDNKVTAGISYAF